MKYSRVLLGAFSAAISLSFATPAMADGGLVLSDMSQMRKLIQRYAMTDPSNFCLRSMTLADANPSFREEITREAVRTSDRYSLGPIDSNCSGVAKVAAQAYTPPAPVYQPPAPVYQPPVQYPQNYYGTYSNNTVASYGGQTQQYTYGGYQGAGTTTQAATTTASNSSTTMAAVGGGSARIAGSHAGFFLGSDLVWASLGLLGAGGAAAALIGGGVLGGGSTTPSTDCDATFDCDEYFAQYTLDRMNGKAAYRRGFNGNGITVAVLDTGLDVNGFEFENRVVSGNGFDFVTNTAGQANASQLSSHGTEVAGVIASNRNNIGMHGVAYNAKLMPLRVFNQSNQSIGSFASAIDFARTNNAMILNGSYGPDTAWHLLSESRNYQIVTAIDLEEGAAYLRAATAGMALVFPAGNDFLNAPNIAQNPTGPGFLPFIRPSNSTITSETGGAYRSEDSGAVLSSTDFSAMEDHTVVVVGVDVNNLIASYSNRCGVAQNWCMAAYSNDIFTTTLNGQYTTVSGTSFAAPQVAGAIAILKQAFPSLTVPQIIDRLFATATDLGVAGVDSIYGNGLLNLELASRPLGVTTLAVTDNLNNSQRYSLASSSLNFGRAFGLDASKALRQMNTVFFDSQDVAFEIALDALTDVNSYQISTEQAVFGFDKPDQRQEYSLGNGLTFAFDIQTNASSDRLTSDTPKDPTDNSVRMNSFTVENQFNDNLSGSVHYKDQEALMLGFSDGDRGRVNRAIAKDGLINPYAAFADDGYASVINTKAFGGKTRVAGFFGHSADDSEAKNFGSQVETAYNVAEGAEAYISLGSLFESNRVLGSKGEGAFGFGDSTTTFYTGAGGKLSIGDNMVVRATAYLGYTDPSIGKNSLITNASSIITSAFNASFEQQNINEEGDALSFGVAQPLRVESGSMSFYIPVARSATSTKIFADSLTQDLAASGREMDMEVNYTYPLAQDEHVSAGALYRFDAGHKEGNQDALGVIRWSKKF